MVRDDVTGLIKNGTQGPLLFICLAEKPHTG